MQKVNGYPSLVKDGQTGVVQNVNESEFRKAKAAKRRLMEQSLKQQTLEERINSLESKMDLIVSLLESKND